MLTSTAATTAQLAGWWASSRATGGTVTTANISGTVYTIHTFTANGTFTINAPTLSVDYLIVGGGGAGGGSGGGSGQLIQANASSKTSGAYSVVVGAGGLKTNAGSDPGKGNTSSVFSANAIGGGAGATISAPPTDRNGASGGGGLGLGVAPGTSTVGQYDGGYGTQSTLGYSMGGGGGGVGQIGGNAVVVSGYSSNGGAGGNGVTSAMNGTSTYYGGGGGGLAIIAAGAPYYEIGAGGAGGSGGGGTGGIRYLSGGVNANATPGSVNSGGGGGGGGTVGIEAGQDGGSGIVIIRYPY
jgi:hypothetical protein